MLQPIETVSAEQSTQTQDTFDAVDAVLVAQNHEVPKSFAAADLAERVLGIVSLAQLEGRAEVVKVSDSRVLNGLRVRYGTSLDAQVTRVHLPSHDREHRSAYTLYSFGTELAHTSPETPVAAVVAVWPDSTTRIVSVEAQFDPDGEKLPQYKAWMISAAIGRRREYTTREIDSLIDLITPSAHKSLAQSE